MSNALTIDFSYLHKHEDRATGERRLLLRLLALPPIIAVMAAVGTAAIALAGLPAKGSLLYPLAGAAYSVLILALLLLPAYSAGFAYFFIKSKTQNLWVCLWSSPIVGLSCIWFPAITIEANNVSQFETIGLVALIAMILGFAWTAILSIALFIWRLK